MRISIWQQFSSNHSSTFTVVGRFGTKAAARDVVSRFTDIFQTIPEWSRESENREWLKQHRENEYHPPTPLEIEFGKQYGVDWGERGIDWLGAIPEERIRQIGKDVFITTDGDTWSHPTPILNLMAKFGGQVGIQLSDKTLLRLHLTCSMINQRWAESVYQEVASYFEEPKGKQPPWTRELRHEVNLNHTLKGTIQQDGSQISMECVFFHVYEGFSALIEWLSWKTSKLEYYFTEEKDY
jgi:hypothetical protein